MTTIVSSQHVTEHQGLRRVSAGLAFIAEHAHQSRLIFAALLAAALVVSTVVIDPSGLGTWLLVWGVAFAVAAVLAPKSAGAKKIDLSVPASSHAQSLAEGSGGSRRPVRRRHRHDPAGAQCQVDGRELLQLPRCY